ncbi:MAG: hypothetical protein KIT16_03375 [Rhodospirillaceae bacterium]|nr:hypothetical protein [Rhodospirillaceae bacterium]
MRAKLLAAMSGTVLLAAAGAAAPAAAADFLGVPLWESYPGQYGYYYDGNYHRAPPGPGYYYDPYSGRYYRRF